MASLEPVVAGLLVALVVVAVVAGIRIAVVAASNRRWRRHLLRLERDVLVRWNDFLREPAAVSVPVDADMQCDDQLASDPARLERS
jgi:hypothetical protein